jgi:flagellar basal body-associated protein FliL
MQTFRFTSKTMSILFLLAIILISLAMSGYSFLVSNHAASLPSIPLMEGMDNTEEKEEKEEKHKEGVMSMSNTKPTQFK